MTRRKSGLPRTVAGGILGDATAMTKSGFCQHPSTDTDSHQYCKRANCTCDCHN